MKFSAVLMILVFMSGNALAQTTLYNSSNKTNSTSSSTSGSPIYNTSRSSAGSSGPINLSRLAPQSSRSYSSSRSSNSYQFSDRSKRIDKTRLAATPERVKDFNKRRLAALKKKSRDSERAGTVSDEDQNRSTTGRSISREASLNDQESANGQKKKRVYYTKPSNGYEKPTRVFKF